MARSTVTIPYHIEDMGIVSVDGLCPSCLLPSIVDSTVALVIGHPASALYDIRLVTVRGCTTGCERG